MNLVSVVCRPQVQKSVSWLTSGGTFYNVENVPPPPWRYHPPPWRYHPPPWHCHPPSHYHIPFCCQSPPGCVPPQYHPTSCHCLNPQGGSNLVRLSLEYLPQFFTDNFIWFSNNKSTLITQAKLKRTNLGKVLKMLLFQVGPGTTSRRATSLAQSK